MNLPLSEADDILRFFKKSKSTHFEMNPERIEKIKHLWKELHEFDHEHEYTFSNDYKILRKEKKEYKPINPSTHQPINP
jgi:hypothetical protein